MITALALLGYAACAAWWVPALLAPLTRRGVSVRAGLAAWLTAMASVLVSAVIAIQFSARTVAADWPRLTQALCRSVAGSACTPAVYGSVLYQAGVVALAAALTLAGVVAAWRYGRRVQRSRAQTRSHARAALLVGRAQPAAGPAGAVGRARTVMLDDPRPAAYCVAGRPAAIVVTSGALAVLDPPQLSAVLAHECAHLAHGHHALATVTRGLAAAFPGIPLFTRGAAEVVRLTEMAADDTAARTSGRPVLVTALIAIATGAAVSSTAPSSTGIPGAAVPAGAMAAASRAVPDRVERMLRPSTPARSRAFTAALALAVTLLAAAPPALAFLAR
ncbi:MAG TPA: M56 family metallopeptidase [Trebonia sp.]|nr:M56 family metallopeptidase [Trebonia sp.]